MKTTKKLTRTTIDEIRRRREMITRDMTREEQCKERCAERIAEIRRYMEREVNELTNPTWGYKRTIHMLVETWPYMVLAFCLGQTSLTRMQTFWTIVTVALLHFLYKLFDEFGRQRVARQLFNENLKHGERLCDLTQEFISAYADEVQAANDIFTQKMHGHCDELSKLVLTFRDHCIQLEEKASKQQRRIDNLEAERRRPHE